jgi:hypothetical protein
VSLKHLRGEVALERGKAQPIIPIAGQQKLIESIAQTADAIVEHDQFTACHWR